MPSPAPTRAATSAVVLLSLCAATGCGGAGTGGTGADAAPSRNVVAGVHKDAAAARQLPRRVRKKGTLRLAASIGAPPSAYRAGAASGKPVGQDIDIADAVGKVLGLKLHRTEASFETILPALDSGKFDAGTGNFGVTDQRRRSIDFVTYVNDGQGLAVRKDDSSLHKVTRLDQLCGKTIGTGAGTTFEKTLTAKRGVCAKRHKKPYRVRVFSENAAVFTALQQSRVDVVMSTTNGLRYQASHKAAGIRFLNEFHPLDVGFAFAKGSPLTKAFRTAVNTLIKNGTYARILRKWGTGKSAIATSRINPPEKK